MNRRLIKVRESLNMNKREFAEFLCITERSIQNYEDLSLNRKIPSEVLRFLYTKAKINPVWMLTGEGGMCYHCIDTDLSNDELDFIRMLRVTPSALPSLKKALIARIEFEKATNELMIL